MSRASQEAGALLRAVIAEQTAVGTPPCSASASTSAWLRTRGPFDRAGHAVATAAALAKLEPLDRDHLDPGLAQRGVGAGVAS
jgi:hypothetical protein